eukprot:2772422-Lingulodinium_polyedra.AAC.1
MPATLAGKRKFSGLKPEDVLQKHGWNDIVEQRNKILDGLGSDVMNSWLRGSDLEAYVAQALQLAKLSSAVQKLIVSLDIKVKKWKDPPPDTLEFLVNERAKITAITHVTSVISGVKKKADANRMEQAMA